jgi:cytochrome c-type biogenesis protein CcmH/NrfG
MTTLDFVNLYEILHVSPTAGEEEIRKAVTKQRRQWVKRTSSADAARRAEAETRVRDIDRAEKTLLNSASRAAFDAELANYRPPVASAPAAANGAAWLERAKGYLRDDNANAANYAAREALNMRGDDHEAWFVRAHSSFLLGNTRDAEYEFGEAIRLQPHSGVYHYGLGEIYAAQEKWKSALSEYEQALRLEPGNPEYQTSIAQVYLMNDMAGKALDIMEQVVRQHPDNPAFTFYLAIALHDSALESLGEIRPLVLNGQVLDEGGFAIISEAQAALISRRADHIDRLGVTAPEIRKMVADMREMVAEATRMRWNLAGTKNWLVAFVVIGIIPLFGGASAGSGGASVLGFLACAAIVALYVWLKRRPFWRHRRKALTEAGRLVREGI